MAEVVGMGGGTYPRPRQTKITSSPGLETKKADRSHRTVKCKKIGPLEFSRAYLRLFARRVRQAHLALFLDQHEAIGSRRSPLES